MAQIPERWDPVSLGANLPPNNAAVKTELGTRRQNKQGVLSIVTGSDPLPPHLGLGSPNAPSVLTLDATDASGNITTWYLWVNRNGKLRIASTFPALELSDGMAVGDQTGT